MMERVKTKKAPTAFGPFCQATVSNGLIYTSGAMPFNPEDGSLIRGGVGEQTRQALENLKNVLEAGGSSMSRVLQITVYLTDMEKFGEMNEVYATYFDGEYPARVTVGVASLAKQAMVELQAVALAD
jgi:2-iminobutanoate/2-iminopropanoate deaminase